MNLDNNNKNFDTWEAELFDGGPKTNLKDTVSTNVLHSEIKLPVNSKQIKSQTKNVLSSIKSVFKFDTPKKSVTSPVEYQSHLPVVEPIKALVPIAGIALAVLLIWGGQKLAPLASQVSLAPDNFSTGVFSSLVIEPSNFLINKTSETVHSLAYAGDKFTTPSFSGWLNKPVIASSINKTDLLSASVLTSMSNSLSNTWDSIVGFLSFYKNLIFNNWLSFLFGDGDENQVDSDQLRAQIKAEVLAEIGQDLENTLNSSGGGSPIISQTSTGQGLVVMPIGEGETPAQAAAKIGSLFSDPVSVRFDESGQAGIITPEFKDPNSSTDYIFVLTQIKK